MSALCHPPTHRPQHVAVANEKRDWRILADFARVLIQPATTFYTDEPFRFELQAAAWGIGPRHH